MLINYFIKTHGILDTPELDTTHITYRTHYYVRVNEDYYFVPKHKDSYTGNDRECLNHIEKINLL